jgi:O-antigen/teichoic acid export membrane protein
MSELEPPTSDGPGAEPSPASTSGVASARRTVLKNTSLLFGAKVLAIPITVGANALYGRFLGPELYSYSYLAGQLVSFGGLFVLLGGNGVLPASVARDRSSAGRILGSALAWRLAISIPVYVCLAVVSRLLNYTAEFQAVLALAMLVAVANAVGSAFQDVVRGYERADLEAMTSVGTPFLSVALSVPVLLLGGRLKALQVVELTCALVAFLVAARFLRRVDPTVRPSADRPTVRTMLGQGLPFLFFGLALTLQPGIDAVFLSKLAPTAAVGWLAAARRLVGLLVFPASALISALYPVLCRLHVTDNEAFNQTTRSAIESSLLIALPAALGCGLFPELGIGIFGEKKFGPAEDDLRILAGFILLGYLSMPIGSALLAGGKANAWSLVQMLCIVFSVVLDPILIPYFQRTRGNGGLGVCVATVVSEVFMVAMGIWLLPRGVLDRTLLKRVGLYLLAALAMAAPVAALPRVTALMVAPLSVIAYATALWALGLVSRQQLSNLRNLVRPRAA